MFEQEAEMNLKVDGSYPSKTYKNFYCTSCRSPFYIKELILKGSRCPMLLQCGHSVCEACLQQSLKLSRVIVCQHCGLSSTLESKDQINKCFPLSTYIIGSIVVLHNARYENNKKLAMLTDKDGNFNYAVKRPSNSTKVESSHTSCEECSSEAFWYCENCRSNYCKFCWSKVHGSAKSLMKHIKVPISTTKNSNKALRKCPKHETQFLEFFCSGCLTMVCSYCIILQHQGEGHNPVILKQENMEIPSKMRAAAEEAEKMKKRMAQTLEKVKLTRSSSEGSDTKQFSKMESQIMRNFSQIHGILQLEEERLLRQLHEKSGEHEGAMKSIQLQLEKQIEYVDSLLLDYDLIKNKEGLGSVDLTDLYRQLTEVESLPCYLISTATGDKNLTISFDDKLLDQLQTYCKLNLPSNESFELRASSDLPEDYAVEPLSIEDFDQSLNPLSKAGNDCSLSDVETLSNCSSRGLGKDSDPQPKVQTEGKTFQERKSYSVRVTYLKNPGEFYIALNSQRSRQQTIDKRASQFASCVSTIPETVSKDELYLVKYNVDKKWYRARVVEFYPAKKLGGEDQVLVYYLDYGNSETVSLSRLRPIPPDILEPPLAVKCKLFDCVPKNGVWCSESTKTMEKILSNYTATMFVMKVHQDCLEVDLSIIYPEGQIGRDIVSVRDALLFLEFSSFVNGPSSPSEANALKYLHQYVPTMGEKFDVIISHVNSPDDFYIQRTKEDTVYLVKLSTELQKYYSENSEKGFIYNPVKGMPCAARFSTDNKWYRAKIVDIPGKKMVTVYYVDYGNTETIPWTEVRKLKENFVKRPPLALKSTLAGIVPANSTWNPLAKAHLEKLVMVRDCYIRVEGRPKPKQKIKVLLYQRVSRKEICVNTLFVESGYAITSRSNSGMLKSRNFLARILESETPSEVDSSKANPDKPNLELEEGKNSDGEIDSSIGYFEVLNAKELKKAFTGCWQDRKKSKPSAKKLREMHESEKKFSTCEDSSAEEIENEVDEYNNILKVKVEILSAESPSSIYVTLPPLNAEFKNLQSKLGDFYKNTSPPDGKEWKEDDMCAVRDSEKDLWYRASIVSVFPDERVKVFLNDVAQFSIVPTSALRELDDTFAKYATCAIKCHLGDIAPPGEQWPSISSEYLLSELENYKEVYMTKRGQIENKSLPVELWVKKIVLKGALEPSSEEWITLNRILVKQGLAVPLTGKMRYASSSSSNYSNRTNESESNQETKVENLSDENETSKESDAFVPSLSSNWLPPEPLKASDFTAIPTYVDYNAFIYLYEADEDGQKLRTITQSLVQEYKNSKPHPEDHFWSEGQLCIARYHLDNSWYRGLILKANEHLTYDVLFVDYGNVEVCQAKDLRKRIKMHEIPVLTHKCRLQGIVSVAEDGSWSVSTIDILHSLVVDKKCEVTVYRTALDPHEPHTVSIKILESGIDAASYLVQQGLANITGSFSDSSSASDVEISRPSSSQASAKTGDDSIIPLYIPLSLPQNCNGLFIEITKVKSETKFFANIIDDESLSPELKRVLKSFDNLQRKLMQEGFSQPLVERALKGHPCCCVNVKNKKWCRAEILNFTRYENSAFVVFVDYGNEEFYNKDSLHECKNEWLTLPKMALEFNLAGVQKCSNVSSTAYMKALTKCLNKAQVFAEILRMYYMGVSYYLVDVFADRRYAKVFSFGDGMEVKRGLEGIYETGTGFGMKHDDYLEVRLLTERNGQLQYQEMIDKKLMELI